MGALSGERWKRHHDLEEGPFQRGIKFLYNSSNPSGALFLGEGNVRGATPFMCAKEEGGSDKRKSCLGLVTRAGTGPKP